MLIFDLHFSETPNANSSSEAKKNINNSTKAEITLSDILAFKAESEESIEEFTDRIEENSEKMKVSPKIRCSFESLSAKWSKNVESQIVEKNSESWALPRISDVKFSDFPAIARGAVQNIVELLKKDKRMPKAILINIEQV